MSSVLFWFCSMHVVDVFVTKISMRHSLPFAGTGVSVIHTKLGAKSWNDISVECVPVDVAFNINTDHSKLIVF